MNFLFYLSVLVHSTPPQPHAVRRMNELQSGIYFFAIRHSQTLRKETELRMILRSKVHHPCLHFSKQDASDPIIAALKLLAYTFDIQVFKR